MVPILSEQLFYKIGKTAIFSSIAQIKSHRVLPAKHSFQKSYFPRFQLGVMSNCQATVSEVISEVRLLSQPNVSAAQINQSIQKVLDACGCQPSQDGRFGPATNTASIITTVQLFVAFMLVLFCYNHLLPFIWRYIKRGWNREERPQGPVKQHRETQYK